MVSASMSRGVPINGLERLVDGKAGGSGITVYLADMDRVIRSWPRQELWDAPEEETSRARRYRDPELGWRFLASRRLLRLLLAHHTGSPAESIGFLTETNGKPVAVDLPLAFSLSRSGTYVAIGLADSGRIGVDIECGATLDTCREVGDRVLSGPELARCPPDDDPQFVTTFLEFWTLKESILKATGEGLARDMREIELRIHSGQPEILSLPPGYGSPENWEIGIVPTGLPGLVLSYARCRS